MQPLHLSPVHAVENNIMQKNNYYYEMWYLWQFFKNQLGNYRDLGNSQSRDFGTDNVVEIPGFRIAITT